MALARVPGWGLFALFGMLAGFGIGNGVQAFEVSSALQAAGVPRAVTGVVLGVLVFAVVVGGIRRIAKAASAIVPLMSILYVAACLVILLINITTLPEAFGTIFQRIQAVAAGVCAWPGDSDGLQTRHFLQRSWPGSAPIALRQPVRPIQCVRTVAPAHRHHHHLTMTALGIISTGAYAQIDERFGSVSTIAAFNTGRLQRLGGIVGLVIFAFTTVLGWCTPAALHLYLFGDAVCPSVYRLRWW